VTNGTRHLFGLLIGLLLLSSQVGAGGAGAHPTPLACPTQQVTWLHGAAIPGQALLVRFAGTVVGGGRVTAAGQWRIPLTIDAPAGIYPVTVVERTSGERIAAFTCYVDLPVGATSTATPTRQPTQQPTTPQPSATATTRPTGTPTLTTTPALPMVTLTPPLPTSPTERNMPTATVPHADTTPTTAPPPSPTPSVPAASAQPAIVLVMVYADDPDDPELFEYVILENRSATVQALTDWQLIHQPTGEHYTFPVVTLPANEQLVVWSGVGLDDPAIGTFFWWASTGRWTAGDTAALATPDGQIVSTLQVALPSADEE
jgi:hypothetical protein